MVSVLSNNIYSLLFVVILRPHLATGNIYIRISTSLIVSGIPTWKIDLTQGTHVHPVSKDNPACQQHLPTMLHVADIANQLTRDMWLFIR
jgi:hypothetical protein